METKGEDKVIPSTIPTAIPAAIPADARRGKLEKVETIDDGNERVYVYHQYMKWIDKEGKEQSSVYTLRRRYTKSTVRKSKTDRAREIYGEIFAENPKIDSNGAYLKYIKLCEERDIPVESRISYRTGYKILLLLRSQQEAQTEGSKN